MADTRDEEGQIASAPSTFEAPSSSTDPLQTLTSGRRRDVKGGSLQAHLCVISAQSDVSFVMEAFHSAAAFQGVVSWCYAYRLLLPQSQQRLPLVQEDEVVTSVSAGSVLEGFEDGLDEGSGTKLLSILKRSSLQGILLVVSRWQDYGATPGLELLGTGLYALIIERSKDLIANLKKAMGISEAPPAAALPVEEPQPKNFDFSFLPPLPEPRVQTKFGPNHFLSDTPLNKPMSLPSLWSGGDVRLWMANDQCLRNLPDSELWALRSLRQPDPRVERVLHAVALLRGQGPLNLGKVPSARWGHLLQVLRSATLRTELLLFDANSISMETAEQALAMLEGLEAEELRRTSSGAAVLFEWAQGVARWRCQGPSDQEAEGAPTVLPLRSREADLSHLPTKKVSKRDLAKASPVRRRCQLTSLERSRSAALLGMTMM